MSSDPSVLDRFFQFTAGLAAPAPTWFAQYLWFPITFALAVIVPFALVGVLLPKLVEQYESVFRGLLAAPFSVPLTPNLLLVWLWRRRSDGRLPNFLYWWGDSVIWTERKAGDFIIWLLTGRYTALLFKWLVFLVALWLLMDWNAGHCAGAGAACATPAANWWSGSLWPLLNEAFDTTQASLIDCRLSDPPFTLG